MVNKVNKEDVYFSIKVSCCKMFTTYFSQPQTELCTVFPDVLIRPFPGEPIEAYKKRLRIQRGIGGRKVDW